MKITKKNAIEAYKGFDMNLTCRDFQYEVGKTYHIEGDVLICKKGFHACRNLNEVSNYYTLRPNHRFCRVKLWGDIQKLRDKLCASNIEIVEEIPYAVLLSTLNLGSDNTGLFNVGNGNTGKCNFGNYNTGNHNVGDYNSGAFNLGAQNQGNSNIGGYNTGCYNVGNFNKGSYNIGTYNYGNFNKGNYNTGWFNTKSWDDYRWFDRPAEPLSVEKLGSIENIIRFSSLSVFSAVSFHNFELIVPRYKFNSDEGDLLSIVEALNTKHLPNWDYLKAFNMLSDYINHYNELQTKRLFKALETLNKIKEDEE